MLNKADKVKLTAESEEEEDEIDFELLDFKLFFSPTPSGGIFERNRSIHFEF